MIPMTPRYVRNLIVKGRNNEFDIIEIKREYSLIDGVNIGVYYHTMIANSTRSKQNAVGVTIEQAVKRCLEKHGVTFR